MGTHKAIEVLELMQGGLENGDGSGPVVWKNLADVFFLFLPLPLFMFLVLFSFLLLFLWLSLLLLRFLFIFGIVRLWLRLRGAMSLGRPSWAAGSHRTRRRHRRRRDR